MPTVEINECMVDMIFCARPMMKNNPFVILIFDGINLHRELSDPRLFQNFLPLSSKRGAVGKGERVQ